MSVASICKEAYVRRVIEGTTIIAGEQDILLNSKQEFLQGLVPSTQSQRGFLIYPLVDKEVLILKELLNETLFHVLFTCILDKIIQKLFLHPFIQVLQILF